MPNNPIGLVQAFIHEMPSNPIGLVQALWEGSYGEVGPATDSHFSFSIAKGSCLGHTVNYV